MTEVQYCRLDDLPDLKQEDPTTKQLLLDWINSTVKEFNIDGLRIDTVEEVPPSFWKEYTESAGVHAVGEVFNGDLDFVASYQGSVPGLLNYPLFFSIRDAFMNGNSMNGL